jgi:hypothetical protein
MAILFDALFFMKHESREGADTGFHALANFLYRLQVVQLN